MVMGRHSTCVFHSSAVEHSAYLCARESRQTVDAPGQFTTASRPHLRKQSCKHSTLLIVEVALLCAIFFKGKKQLHLHMPQQWVCGADGVGAQELRSTCACGAVCPSELRAFLVIGLSAPHPFTALPTWSSFDFRKRCSRSFHVFSCRLIFRSSSRRPSLLAVSGCASE